MKSFLEITESSLYEDIKSALMQMSSETVFTAHETPEGEGVFSWRKGFDRYVLNVVWDGGPHLTLFHGVDDCDGIIAGMTDDWPDEADPAFQVFCKAIGCME